MTNLSTLLTDIDDIIQDPNYGPEKLTNIINRVILRIAAGIRMPDNQILPPLPELYTYGTILTDTSYAYTSLPDDYQRNVILIVDEDSNQYSHPSGGNYYSYRLFLDQVTNKNLTDSGSIYIVAIRGSKLYYQGIPSSAKTIGIHYYKKPALLQLDTDIPDCIPDHLQHDLIIHGVCKDIYGLKIEDGLDNAGIGVKYHTGKYYESAMDLLDYIGIDGAPTYYGSDNYIDLGTCDG